MTLDTRSLFPTLVFVSIHLQFLPFNLNLISKQQSQKLPGWSKYFFYRGQLTPFISWREKGSDFEHTDFIKEHPMHAAFTAADYRETVLTLGQKQVYAKINTWTPDTVRAFCWVQSWKPPDKRRGPSTSRQDCVTLLRARKLSSKGRADTPLPSSSTPPQPSRIQDQWIHTK